MTNAFRPMMTGASQAAAPVTVPDLEGVAVGCDVVEVARIGQLLARRPAAREALFTPVELADAVRDGVAADDPAATRRLAARFAAKEAVVKLLRRPALAWTDVEVRLADDGAPQLWIHGQRSDIAVSLSHGHDVAMAVVATCSPTTSTAATTSTTTTAPASPTSTTTTRS